VPPPALAPSISREDLANLAIRRYEGRVVLVETPQQLDEARADLLQEGIVGLDTETRPAFRKGESHLPCLVQVATGRAAYLVPLRYREAFPALAALLEDERIVKAGVGLAFDLRQLKLVFPFAQRSVVDLGVAARRAGLEQAGVRNLAGICLGFRIPKGSRTSNWAAPRLTPAQITYAATDAWACRELYLRLESLGVLARQALSRQRPAGHGP
jgi:ribonuclease D